MATQIDTTSKSKYQTLSMAEEQHLVSKSVTTKKVTSKTKKLSSNNEVSQQLELTNASDTNNNKEKSRKTSKTKGSTTSVQVVEKSQTVATTTEGHTTAVAENNLVKKEEGDEKKTKTKKSKKKEADGDTISVKSSFSKFENLQKRNLIHNPQGEKETNCKLCTKPVYKMEEIKAEKNTFHKNCFRCHNCNKQLKVDNYQSHEGVLYCTIHFKLLFVPKFVEDTEPTKPHKPELIIRENQPIELPPDVVRASDKPDLGLEELQQLNVRSRFQVFENCAKNGDAERNEPPRNPNESAGVKRSTSILTKLAKLQALGFTAAGISAEDLAAAHVDNYSGGSSEEDEDQDTAGDNEDDIIPGRSRRGVQRERPIGLGNAMNDIKTKFESGHMMSKEERREERKQEIQNIRSRLFLGKQARIKEQYQQAVAESEQGITSVGKKPDVEIGDAARTLRERFENGDIFKNNPTSDEENGGGRSGGIKDEADVFESAISKKSRSIFMELDANTAGNQSLPTKPNHPQSARGPGRWGGTNSEQQKHQLEKTDSTDVVKYDEKPEDVKIETSKISEKFKFFETYRGTDNKPNQKKEFRITPPREGVVKMPSPELKNDENEKAETLDETNMLERSHTTAMMLNKFREMEQSKRSELRDRSGPRPLKCFTPPPDGGHRIYQNQDNDSQDEDDDDEEDEDEDEDEPDEFIQPKLHMHDEALKEAQAAARAKHLRAKFEKWESNEIQSELNGDRLNIYSQQVSDDSSIESTKLLREHFENMKNMERNLPARPRHTVNRFV